MMSNSVELNTQNASSQASVVFSKTLGYPNHLDSLCGTPAEAPYTTLLGASAQVSSNLGFAAMPMFWGFGLRENRISGLVADL